MKTVALVPIKMNNERTPGKNIKPLIEAVIPLCDPCRSMANSMCDIGEQIWFQINE